jgi:hypothetical protein
MSAARTSVRAAPVQAPKGEHTPHGALGAMSAVLLWQPTCLADVHRPFRCDDDVLCRPPERPVAHAPKQPYRSNEWRTDGILRSPIRTQAPTSAQTRSIHDTKG